MRLMRRGTLVWLSLLALPIVVGAVHGLIDRRFASPLTEVPWPPQGPQEPATTAPRLRLPQRAPPLTYDITARLEPRSKRIKGRLRVRFANRTRAPLSELRLHLYLNAFSSDKTRFARSSGGSHRGRRAGEGGWIRVETPQLDDRNSEHAQPTKLTSRLTKRQTSRLTTALSAKRLYDGTVLALRLPAGRAIAPGSVAALSLAFEAKLPKIYARTGHAEDLFMVAQWYPKLGVLLPDGSWHCPPFHANAEFFADFARYRLRFTLPTGFVVGHTGALTKRRVLAGGREQELTLEARWVHDLALCAWPHFVERRRVVDGVALRLLTVPGRGKATRQLDLVAFGLRELGRWFGAYPYRRLTVVDLPASARGADAMEYPQLFTIWYPFGAPQAVRAVDEVLLHELTHQYFQGLVATNEVREPWLDEGLTTFVSGLLADRRFGARRSFVDLDPLAIGQVAKNQLHQASGADDVPIARPAARFSTWRRYGSAVYGRTAALLYSVGSLIGRRRLLQGLRDYVQRYAFAHPTRAQLVAALARAAPEPTRPALAQLLQAVLDGERPYEVTLSCERDTLVLDRGELRLPLTIRWRRAKAAAGDPRGQATTHPIEVPTSGPARLRLPAKGLLDAELGPPERLPLSVRPLTRRCSRRDGSWGAAARLTPLIQSLLGVVTP